MKTWAGQCKGGPLDRQLLANDNKHYVIIQTLGPDEENGQIFAVMSGVYRYDNGEWIWEKYVRHSELKEMEELIARATEAELAKDYGTATECLTKARAIADMLEKQKRPPVIANRRSSHGRSA